MCVDVPPILCGITRLMFPPQNKCIKVVPLPQAGRSSQDRSDIKLQWLAPKLLEVNLGDEVLKIDI